MAVLKKKIIKHFKEFKIIIEIRLCKISLNSYNFTMLCPKVLIPTV